jgi:hypothetical protein
MGREHAVCPNHHFYPSDISFSSACRHILNDHRAIFDARAASGTAVFDDGAGSLFDFDFEIAGGALNAFKVCVGNQFNVQMPADLDQFR